MELKPGHIELFVADPLRSREFYSKLGFRVQEIQLEQYVWMDLHGLTILLRPQRTPQVPPTYQDAPSGIVIYTDNLSEAKEELERNGVEFAGTDGSDRCLTFADPDGNWFQLVDPDDH